jgi:pimeloyl-ACP methyl ester carboxylesterase
VHDITAHLAAGADEIARHLADIVADVSRPAFVLVHGGYHTARCWEKLAPHLDGDIQAIDLPGRGVGARDVRHVTLSDWTDAVVEAIDRASSERVLLVGHSLAGVFLPTAAARRASRIERLVLVAGVMPREGSTQRKNLPVAGRIGARLQTRNGVLRPPPAWLARMLFCNDMDRPTTRWAQQGLVPEASGVFDEPVSRRGLPRVPTTYVRLKRDRAVTAAVAKRQITNYGHEVDVVEIDAGHDVMVSRPEALARVLNGLASPTVSGDDR